jgi:competence protein ComEA
MEKHCARCHEVAKSYSIKQDRDGWQATMNKMAGLGLKAPDAELAEIFEYLVKNYPADAVAKLKINECRAIEMESALGLKRSQAAAVIAYREKHGPFKSFEDLKKVPGLDPAKLEEKKDRLAY